MYSVNNNMGAMRSMDALNQSHRLLQTSLERLSTGVRINRAEDDAAGVMVRDRFQAQVNGFEEGIRNIQTAQGMIQVAEQGLNKVTEALQQMRALAVRAADDNLNDDDRGRIQEQVKGLLREINERASSTSYNGKKLLDGSIADSHEERLGTSKIQGNSFLANGSHLVSGTATTGTAATTANAISQGSYQVKLVFSGEHGVTAGPTTATALNGVVNSGPNGDGLADVTTLNQNITDRNGGAHTASFTLTQVGDGSRNFNYEVNIAAGGVYGAAQSFTGTVEFNADGSLAQVDSKTGGDHTRSVTLGDGTAAGQAWTIDFGGLVENQHATTTSSAPASNAALADGSAGAQTTFADFTGNLDDSTPAGSNVFAGTAGYVDRLGQAQFLTIQLTKTLDGGAGNGNDQWSWQVLNDASLAAFGSGGSTLAAGGSGTLTFTAGAVTAGGLGSVTIDNEGVNQVISLDFTALSNTTGAVSFSTLSMDGTLGTPSANVAVAANLVSGSAAPTASFSVVDRTGTDSVAGHTIDFTEVAANQWSYTITPNGASGFTGTGTNLTGLLTFDSSGNLAAVNGVNGATTLSAVFDDASSSALSHSLTFDLSAVSLDRGSLARATSNGLAGTSTSSLTAAGNLDSDHVISDSLTTPAFNVVDRTGAEHSVSISYTKVSDTASGETWTYNLNGLSGGVWDGANSGNESGTLQFDNAGALIAINGGSPATFSLRIGDGTTTGQDVTVDLTGVTNTSAADSQSASADGTQGTPTTSIQLADNLISSGGPMDVVLDVIDRTGTDRTLGISGGAGPRVTFSQIGETNTWNYTITAPSGSGYNGFGSGLQGQVEFDDAGNLIALDGTGTLSKTINFGDGTAEGHAIALDFTNLNMGHADDLGDSISDGGSGTDQGLVSAVVYYSDGSGKTDLNPVSTLHAIDQGARTYQAGGIRIDVAQASTLDVGLTSYVKAHTYVSATREDRALTFQVGPDEGNVTRVGIAKMDVQTIFRRNENHQGESAYTDIDLSNALKAQDLIGQIDDALDFVGAENLKVGQFQNKFGRTLELARQQMTSTANALSNLNDADMAKEATNQSKRSILVQSGTAMVAQANSQGQFLLQLLR